MITRRAVLLGGPYAGAEVDLDGEFLVVHVHLYELTVERAETGGRHVPVYRHRIGCCDGSGMAVDTCE